MITLAEHLLRQSKELEGKLTAFRRDLHRYPELSTHEAETAGKVAAELRKLGYTPTTGVGGHGVVAELTGDRPGPVIALRADMDALPIQEETGLPYASARPGVMHACGHDGHTAMLLGAAELLMRNRDRLAGSVRLLFQAAEEINAGAKAMIADGVLEDVSEIYGLHNLPTLPAGQMAIRYGALMGSVDRIELTLEGKGGHGAIPDQSIDPIVAASAIVMGLQTAVSREMSPFEPAVVTIGSIHAGEANNVIPHQAKLTGTVRTFSEAARQSMPGRLDRLIGGIAQAYRCKAELRYINQTAVLVNHDGPAAQVERIADLTLGAHNRKVAEPTMAGEDFSEYLLHVPGSFFWIGSGPDREAERAYGLHHPKFALNEACLPYGAALLAAIALLRSGQQPD